MPAGTLEEPRVKRRVADAVGLLTTPLLPDDYLTLVNPLWALRDLRGRIEQRIDRPGDAATIVIRPGRQWPGHEAGQHLALGVDVDGVRHWRSYSLTSDPGRDDGCISITVRAVDGGKVSSHLVHRAVPGEIVRLGPPEGDFRLAAAPSDAPLLFITAGSGITPVASMLRQLEREGRFADVVHLHSERTPERVIFGPELRELAERQAGVRLVERDTSSAPRLTELDLDDACPDWRERQTFACGPFGLLDRLEQHWEQEQLSGRLHLERFEIARVSEPGDGGTVAFAGIDMQAQVPAGSSILEAAEAAGVPLQSGCRMGICHRCVCTLESGQVRDLRTGELHSEPGQFVQVCISGAAGDVELSA